MEEKYIVRNNSGTILRLTKYRITLNINQTIDLVTALNKSVSEIKRDVEIAREMGYRNLVLVEEVVPIANTANLDPSKLDEIINLLKEQKVVQQFVINNSSVEANSVKAEIDKLDEEEKMREDALLFTLGRSKSPKVKNIKDMGNAKKIENADDFGDKINF